MSRVSLMQLLNLNWTNVFTKRYFRNCWIGAKRGCESPGEYRNKSSALRKGNVTFRRKWRERSLRARDVVYFSFVEYVHNNQDVRVSRRLNNAGSLRRASPKRRAEAVAQATHKRRLNVLKVKSGHMPLRSRAAAIRHDVTRGQTTA